MGRVARGASPETGGALVRERLTDVVGHPFEVVVQASVPEPENLEPFPREDTVPHPVVIGLALRCMVRAVEFNHQAAIETDEIQEIALERRLTTEVESVGAEGLSRFQSRTSAWVIVARSDRACRVAGLVMGGGRVTSRTDWGAGFSYPARLGADATRHPPHKGGGYLQPVPTSAAAGCAPRHRRSRRRRSRPSWARA